MIQRTDTRFRDVLHWATGGAFGCLLLYGTIGLVYAHQAMLVSATLIATYMVVLITASMIKLQQRTDTVTLVVGFGLVITAVGLTLAQPALWPNYAVVPLLAAALLLQYAPRLRLLHVLVLCGAATASIVALGEALPPAAPLPAPFLSVLRGVSLLVTVLFVLVLLWQFRARLNDLVQEVQTINATLETRNVALVEANTQLHEQFLEREYLLAQVLALETPVTRFTNDMLYAPLFGPISTQRAAQLRRTVLEAVYHERARWILIDIGGVPQMTPLIVQEFNTLFQAIKLLGCTPCVCGLTASLAQTLAYLPEGFADVLTTRTPQEALHHISGAR